jgi:hypothetical protein
MVSFQQGNDVAGGLSASHLSVKDAEAGGPTKRASRDFWHRHHDAWLALTPLVERLLRRAQTELQHTGRIVEIQTENYMMQETVQAIYDGQKSLILLEPLKLAPDTPVRVTFEMPVAGNYQFLDTAMNANLPSIGDPSANVSSDGIRATIDPLTARTTYTWDSTPPNG